MENKEGFLDRFLAKRIGHNEEFATELIRLSRQGHLCMISGEDFPVDRAIVRDGNRYYLRKNWEYETKLIEEVKRLTSLSLPSIHDETKFQEALATAPLQPEQGEAIRAAFARSFSLICGGPGTGKTYTASILVRLLAASFQASGKFYVCLAAPTGKAASHLEKTLYPFPEVAQVKTATLHRLLKNKGRIDADLVIVDEGSMIDIAIWVRLLEAIGNKTRLIILGDPDQLPPVEAGSLFAEMAPLFGVSLGRCMRTEEAQLHALAQAIRTGDGDAMLRILSVKPDIEVANLFDRLSLWTGIEKPDPAPMLSRYRRLGILNALRQGAFGSEAIQRQILDTFVKSLKKSGWWAIPILVTANEPRLELYNGTFGVLIGQGEQTLANLQGTAYFPKSDGNLSAFSSPPPIEPAFCISIHKSQGSEFEEVIAIFPQGSQRLGREALYTAVTRAKKKLEWFGEEKTLREMVGLRSSRVSGFMNRVGDQVLLGKLDCHD